MEKNRRRNALQGYFAGIVDGEGHFSIHLSKGSWYCHVTVQMTDPQAVMLLWRAYPEASLHMTHTRDQRTGLYVIALSGHHAWTFLNDIIPFLVIKQRQARVMRAFLAHRRRSHWRRMGKGADWRKGHDCRGRCQHFAQALLDLRAAAKGVNTVNALLAHGLREYRAKREDVVRDVAAIAARIAELLERVETRDRAPQPVEPTSAPEQEIVQAGA